jgi:hypothetical protein
MGIYDEIGQYAAEKAARDLRLAEQEYQTAVSQNDWDHAATCLRHIKYHSDEIAAFTPAQQLTPAQQTFLNARPSIRDNPQKLEALRADYMALLKAGVPDDSSQMYNLLSQRHDPQPGQTELPDPAEMISIVSRSRHFNGDKEEARKALAKSYNDVQAELRNRGGKWEDR